MAQTPSYTNLYVNHNQRMMEEQFPTSPGGRYHTFITNKGDNDDNEDIAEFSKGILTLLKDTLYSLSIKLEAIDNYTVKNLKYKFNGEIYVFDIKKNCYKINDSYNDYKVTHILIIGNFQNNSEDTSQKEFVISKTYLIINVEIKGTAKYTEGVSSEEYLNLYYIEHFSLDIKEFMEIYSKYIIAEVTQPVLEDRPEEQPEEGEEREGLKKGTGLANSLADEVMQGALATFPDGEGAVGPVTGVPVTGDNGNGEIADGSSTVVPIPDAKGGGKKLASKVKKIKNKKK